MSGFDPRNFLSIRFQFILWSNFQAGDSKIPLEFDPCFPMQLSAPIRFSFKAVSRRFAGHFVASAALLPPTAIAAHFQIASLEQVVSVVVPKSEFRFD